MKPVLITAAAALLAACVGGPDEAAPSWTDASLRERAPSSAPDYIAEETLTDEERLDLVTAEAATLAARARVRRAAATFEAPTVDTADFVVEARERATPPPQ